MNFIDSSCLSADLSVRLVMGFLKCQSALVAKTPEWCKRRDVQEGQNGWRGQSSSSPVLEGPVLQSQAHSLSLS